MEGPDADSEEEHEPVSDIDTVVVVVGLKALDPERPIREAIGRESVHHAGSPRRPQFFALEFCPRELMSFRR